eukprot:scaffold34_cov62-Phaeocystis_antarctica.AAC.1
MRPLFHVSIPRARSSRAPFLGLLCFLTVVDALQLRMPTSCGCPPVADAHQLQMPTSCGCLPVADAYQLRMPTSCGCLPVADAYQLRMPTIPSPQTYGTGHPGTATS